MSDYLLAAILGVIEGLTEFLPVSSTAHLRISQALMGIDLKDHYWTMFSIVIQTGAILSVPIYFWGTIREFLADFPRGPRGDRSLSTHPLTLVAVAFVFTAGPSLLLTKVIGKNLESIRAMALALVIGGVLMWIVDALCARPGRSVIERVDEIGIFQAVWIGICQALSAIFPGTSRSMATISGGQLAGMSRPVALEFSFLLAIPTMLAAGAFDLLRSLRAEPAGIDSGAIQLGSLHGVMLLLIGGGVAFVVAYFSVAWFMQWVRRHGFAPFAVYRILVGALLLLYSSRLIG